MIHPTRQRLIAATAAVLVTASVPLFAQASKKSKQPAAELPAVAVPHKPETVDLEFVTRLREEEFRHSEVMDIMSSLTDDIGPRLTGSPNMKRANEWTRDALAKYGLVNAHIEPWGTFGRGWQYQFASVRMTSPDYMQFLALPEAWTPGTNGPVKAEVVHVVVATSADFDKYRGKLAGKIVALGETRVPDPIDKPLFRRESQEDLDKIAEYEIPPARPARNPQEFMQRFKLQKDLNQFLMDEKVAAVLKPTRQPGDGGTIFVQSGGSYTAGDPEGVPSVVLPIEHFGRVVRLLDKGKPVEVEVNVQANFLNDDLKAYNTIAEIPGTDPKLKDQIVMLGGHMDSWHSGEGATDNAAGVSVAMEAVRLLKELGVQPRRTIRIALWSGEEEGLYGSRGYVTEHFGGRPESTDPKLKGLPSFLRPPAGPLQLKPEQKLISAYFNLDNGTGRIRGVYLQENEQVRPIFEEWIKPFRDLGMTTLSARNTGSTDHVSFDAVGIPGFQFIQDPMDYSTQTHHSNLDVYERIRPDDLKQASLIMASFVYNVAMRDEMIPRKPIRPDEQPKQESESGKEKQGEPAPPSSNPANPSQPMPKHHT